MDDSVADMAAVHGFLALVAEDRASGRVRTLADYVALFPDHAQVIAAEYVALCAADPDEEGAQQVGAYRLLRELGRGGQAAVWLAQDTRLPRRVALKVLRRGPATRHRELRLRREAEATARLDDPGICQVFEIGQDRGDAWIAMRYVPGSTLAEHIRLAREKEGTSGGSLGRTTSLSGSETTRGERIVEIVALFERIARSVHRAHVAGVVHRDLKPGNIMVGEDGTPVVLDFGLAHDDSDGPTLTQSGDVFGTPAYMAPEQVRGSQVDARCDVYALGVSLFEALTLRRPFDAPTREGLFAQILRGETASLRLLNPAVSRDLAVVVATAMEADALRRYHTALDLADDLRRVRSHEPIHARPPGVCRRTLQFARRHRAAAGVFAALLAGLATTVAQMLRAATARDEATAQASVARAVNRYLVEVFARANPEVHPSGRTITAPELLQLADESAAEALSAQLRSLAAVQLMLGQANHALGEYGPAAEQLQRALALRRQASEGAAGADELIESLLALASLHTATNDFVAAEQALAEAAQRAAWGDDDDGEPRLTYLQVKMAMASARGDARSAKATGQELLRLLAIRRPPTDRTLQETRVALGALATQLGEFAEAAAIFAECRLQQGDRIDSTRVTLLINEAGLHWHQGRNQEAAAGFREALAAQRQVCGDENNLVAGALINLGVVSRHMGERDNAQRYYEEALAMLRKLHGDDHVMVAITRTNLARVSEDAGRLEEAIDMHRAALATHRKLGGERSQDYLACLHNLAGALLAHGSIAEARAHFADLVERRRGILGDDHLDVADSLVGLARATLGSDAAAAETHYRAASAIYRAAVGDADPRALDAELGIVSALAARGGDHLLQAADLGAALYARAVAVMPATDPLPTMLAGILARACARLTRGDEAAAWEARARR